MENIFENLEHCTCLEIFQLPLILLHIKRKNVPVQCFSDLVICSYLKLVSLQAARTFNMLSGGSCHSFPSFCLLCFGNSTHSIFFMFENIFPSIPDATKYCPLEQSKYSCNIQCSRRWIDSTSRYKTAA